VKEIGSAPNSFNLPRGLSVYRGVFVLKENSHINAPLERVFLLSTSLAIVERELGMHPVARGGPTRTEGLVVGGDRVRWEGWQLGMPQYHVSLISRFEPFRFFQDTMVAGRFKFFQHDHEFTELQGHVLLKDVIRFSMPFGPLGKLVGKYIMVPHIRGLMARRFALLRQIAESEEWRRYLPEERAA
jgi:ligand-binding SRPBCC domain-containing protein